MTITFAPRGCRRLERRRSSFVLFQQRAQRRFHPGKQITLRALPAVCTFLKAHKEFLRLCVRGAAVFCQTTSELMLSVLIFHAVLEEFQ